MPTRDSMLRALWTLGFVCLGGGLIGACSGPAPESTGPSSEARSDARHYHVQLRLTEEKARATETLGRATRWWREQSPADRPPLVQKARSSETPVTIAWKAPFYRVRLGPFATEPQAEAVLDAARSAFPDAFVAPSRPDAAP